MSNAEQIELVKAHVALSNTHRVELISSMKAESAVYDSDNFGHHVGSEAIVDVMRDIIDH